MDFRRLQQRLKRFSVFSLGDIRKIDPQFDRRRLTEWQQRGWIRKILRGHYVMEEMDLDEAALFCIASAIYRPSYVSLHMALAHYGIIPESTYAVTCVTTKKTTRLRTSVATYLYRSIKPSLFFGYTLLPCGEQNGAIAEPEKALLDLLYLDSTLRTKEDLDALRLNRNRISEIIDWKKFDHYASAFDTTAMKNRVLLFRSYIDHADT